MCKITHCVKLHSVCKSTHFRICVNYTLVCKTAHFVQYQSSFFHVSIQKFYTWLIFFTQPAVVMVVTNMKYAGVCLGPSPNFWRSYSVSFHRCDSDSLYDFFCKILCLAVLRGWKVYAKRRQIGLLHLAINILWSPHLFPSGKYK